MDLTGEDAAVGPRPDFKIAKAVAEDFKLSLAPIDVFVGYTTEDSLLANLLIDALKREDGLEVWWMDSPSHPIPYSVGVKRGSLIALGKSSLAVFVVTGAWRGQVNCTGEWEFAYRPQSGGLPQLKAPVFEDGGALQELLDSPLVCYPEEITDNIYAMADVLRGSQEELARWAQDMANLARSARSTRDEILGVVSAHVERPEQPAPEELLKEHSPAPVSWETAFDVVSENDANICVRLRAGCQATGGITRALMTELGWCSRKQTWAMTRAQYESEFLPIVSRELGRL